MCSFARFGSGRSKRGERPAVDSPQDTLKPVDFVTWDMMLRKPDDIVACDRWPSKPFGCQLPPVRDVDEGEADVFIRAQIALLQRQEFRL